MQERNTAVFQASGVYNSILIRRFYRGRSWRFFQAVLAGVLRRKLLPTDRLYEAYFAAVVIISTSVTFVTYCGYSLHATF